MLTFGPIPSRRLGKSLGVNNIPPKYCSYYCVYCQIGTALDMGIERRTFFNPEEITSQVIKKINQCKSQNEQVDYISFVPDGEPTLDINLGKVLSTLRKATNIPLAVITNSTLLWRKEVRQELNNAHWVSVKVDSVEESVWKKINHPCKGLDFDKMLDGIRDFAKEFQGTLMTETMLIKGLNDNPQLLRKNAEFIASLNPHTAFLGIPTRPPARKGTLPPNEEQLAMAHEEYAHKINNVEVLMGYEGNAYASSGNPKSDILSITSVHPMRKDAVEQLLKKNQAPWEIVEELISNQQIKEVQYNNHTFYLRRLKRKPTT